MCGITGFLARDLSGDDARAVVVGMTDAIVHRGPDDAGVWVDPAGVVAFGHRRLSVIDVSPTGHQPMASPSDRYVIVFNGEIYNFRELRDELRGDFRFRGTSDTEVVLACVDAWGIENAVRRLRGMFAMAIWDKEERVLTLARDRVGEKPLYYGWVGGDFLFGSELKALRQHPSWEGRIDRGSLASYMRLAYVPGPYSIFEGIKKLPPGCLLSIAPPLVAASMARPKGSSSEDEPRAYWSARHVIESGVDERFTGTEALAADNLEDVLRDTIAKQMVADVPLGAFLSGGVDSTMIVALMQSLTEAPVKTFTIGFHEEGYNEAVFAKEVARHLGTEHTEMYVTSREALDVIPSLPRLYDEPFADSSQIPTFLVSKIARQNVTVCLSGDGGDELFGGYQRYFRARSIWKAVGNKPKFVRRMAGATIGGISAPTWDRLCRLAYPFLPKRMRHSMPGERLHKLVEVLRADSPLDIYRRLVSHWKRPEEVVLDASEYPTPMDSPALRAQLDDFTEQMMYMDMVTYLPDDILVKVDRAAMGVSLETRAPFLDHKVVEFASRIPLHMKIRKGQGKWLLRQVLDKYVPRELIDRPKAGFGVPIDAWLRGPLRDWAEALLNSDRLSREGYFSPTLVRRCWEEHLSGRNNWQHLLWNVLMFQAWIEDWGE